MVTFWVQYRNKKYCIISPHHDVQMLTFAAIPPAQVPAEGVKQDVQFDARNLAERFRSCAAEPLFCAVCLKPTCIRYVQAHLVPGYEGKLQHTCTYTVRDTQTDRKQKQP